MFISWSEAFSNRAGVAIGRWRSVCNRWQEKTKLGVRAWRIVLLGSFLVFLLGSALYVVGERMHPQISSAESAWDSTTAKKAAVHYRERASVLLRIVAEQPRVQMDGREVSAAMIRTSAAYYEDLAASIDRKIAAGEYPARKSNWSALGDFMIQLALVVQCILAVLWALSLVSHLLMLGIVLACLLIYQLLRRVDGVRLVRFQKTAGAE